MTTFLLGVLVGIPLGGLLSIVSLVAYALWDTRHDLAEPDPPRTDMGDEPMRERG